MVQLAISQPTSIQSKEEQSFDLDQFIVDGENFFECSDFQYSRTFSDHYEANDESVIADFNLTKFIIYAPDDIELVKKLVGHRGYNFITMTERSNVEKIWHNRENNTIEITGGEHKNRMFAMNLIRKKLKYFIKGLEKKKRVLPHNLYFFNGQPFFYPSHLSENY
tara:strand:- start:8 stop:502 length:495 start_codon:yes stop_codon:yes gene_type:complete